MADKKLEKELKWAGLSPGLIRLVKKAHALMASTGMTFGQAKKAVHGRYDDECSAIKDALNKELVDSGTFDTLAEAEAFEKAGTREEVS